MSDYSSPPRISKGRGAISNQNSRFDDFSREHADDGWVSSGTDESQSVVKTEIYDDTSRTIITRNQSPDVPFDRSVNPYKGCEHGCVYCFARPTHAYLGLSPGLDFETKLFVKKEAPTLLKKELSKSGYQPATMALGANTDPYQPVERKLQITRQLLEVLRDFHHPVAIVTKSALIERDIDILAYMAKQGLVQVAVSVTTLSPELSRHLEPRAPTPSRRIEAIQALHKAGIPVGVLFAPVIPSLNDGEMESVLQTCTDAGSQFAGYVMLRLPHEVKSIFKEWLEHYASLKAKRVMNILREIRGGKEYQSQFGVRMKGCGNYADLIAKRFQLACRRLGLNKARLALDSSQFRVPAAKGKQLNLF